MQGMCNCQEWRLDSSDPAIAASIVLSGQKGHRAAQWSLVGRGRGHLKEKNLRKPKCGAANEDEGPPKMRYSSWLYRSSSPPSPSTTKRAEERELGVALKAARWAFRTGMLNFVKRLGGKSATLLAECALPYALCIVNVYVNKYITVSILMVRVSSIGRASSALTLFCHTFHTKCLPVSMTRLSQCFAMARIGGFFVLSCLVL